MRKRSVSIYLRVSEGLGKQPYHPACYAANGSLKPLYALIGGKPTHRPEANYYLRFRTKDGKRRYEFVGADPKLALTKKLQREHIITGEDLGLPTLAIEPPLRPVKTNEEGLGTAPRFIDPKAPPLDGVSGRLALSSTIALYVAEKRELTTKGRAREYQYQLDDFLKQTKITYLDEVDDNAVVAYILYLRRERKSARTIENRVANLSAFLKRYGLEKRFSKRHVPKPTNTIPRAYTAAIMEGLFAAATSEEWMTFQFFLRLGMREREVAFASWADLNWETGVFRVTEKLDMEFRIKDREERDIPVPTDLLEALAARYRARTHPRWIFHTAKGQPNGHLLRTLQELALRAGLNCGMCVTRGGASCKDTACCRQFGLHQFRRTFATLHHKAGVSIRQLMLWLGHADVQTTLAYLSAAEAESAEARVLADKTWEQFKAA